MQLPIKTITLILGSLLIASIVYNVKQYRESIEYHREVATVTMNVLATLYQAVKDIELDGSLIEDEKNDIAERNNVLLRVFLLIGANSIEKVYDELSDEQKQMIWEIRKNHFNQITSEKNE